MATERRKIRLLQLSDVLLDARLSFKGLDMTPTKRHERNSEALEAVLSLCQFAGERQADAVLIVGNLWDSQAVTAATVSRLVDAFAALGDTLVLICPGISDPYSAQSFYEAGVLAAFAIRPWSKNVHIFSGSGAKSWIAPSLPEIAFEGEPCKGITVKSTSSSSTIYAAFSGTQNYTETLSESGTITGACGGSLIGRSIEELGPRNALWIGLSPTDSDAYSVTVDRIPGDQRQLQPVVVNINGIRAGNVPEHIRKAVDAAHIRESDLLYLKVSGIYPSDSIPDFGIASLQREYYHVIVSDSTRPDYFLDKLDPRTTEGRFIQYLQDLKVQADARGGSLPSTEYGAPLTSRIIEDALYYGLDALNQKKVQVPDVD